MIHLDSSGTVHTIRLDSGENRFNPESTTALLDAIATAAATARPVIITGTGKFFSNGLDLDAMSADSAAVLRLVHRVYEKLLDYPGISVAAINGHAFGAGAMLAAACDFRVMREDRGFLCYPEVDLNMTLTPGMEALVVSKLSRRTLHEALVTGRRYGGADALSRWLVDFVVPESELMPRALAVATELAGKNGTSVRALRRQLHARALSVLAGD
jgi:enoyl-CoA hydratase/carnithine racemase